MTESPDNFPHCCYLSLPAEIIAVRHNCFELYWGGAWVAEFSCQEAAEKYLAMEMDHVL